MLGELPCTLQFQTTAVVKAAMSEIGNLTINVNKLYKKFSGER